MKACTTNEWELTDCFFGGSFNISMDKRTTLLRPYVRVDRIKLQALMRDRYLAAGGIGIDAKVPTYRIANNLFQGDSILHASSGSTVSLDNGDKLECKVIVDATGFESRLVARETPFYARQNFLTVPVGYQIAYGFIAHVDSLGPYDYDAMTLFDYRSDHLSDPKSIKDGSDRPTFMYTMPLGKLPDGGYRVFFEETSLVGRGKRRLGFEECKERAMKRLAYHNIKVFGIEEEELCYIPMGGELPDASQRIIAFGAAANMVHPATGYQACRMLSSVSDIATIISDGVQANQPPDQISANAYRSLWNRKSRKQRDFQVFGGDFLMEQNIDNIRGFFTSFFVLDMPVWSGFLAGYPGLPNNELHERWDKRLKFALQMFFNMPFQVAMTMIYFAILHTAIYGPNTLLRSLTPDFVFGPGPEEPVYQPSDQPIGDEVAKEEARKMYREFVPTAGAKVHEKEAIPAPYN
jgi:lycopene beta-cyclase